MATEFGPVIMLGVGVAVVAGAANWGAGWGRVSMLLTLLAGVAVAGVGYIMQSYLSQTVTIGTVSVNGQDIPLAAVEPGTGVQVALLAGAIVAVLSLAGFVTSFRSK